MTLAVKKSIKQNYIFGNWSIYEVEIRHVARIRLNIFNWIVSGNSIKKFINLFDLYMIIA